MVVPVGAIVGGIGAATVLLTLLTLSLFTWHRKRAHDAATQYRIDQFKMSLHVQPQRHFHPSSITTSSFSAPAPASEVGQGHFQRPQPLPAIRELNSTPSLPNPLGKGPTITVEPRNDDAPPAYYAG